MIDAHIRVLPSHKITAHNAYCLSVERESNILKRSKSVSVLFRRKQMEDSKRKPSQENNIGEATKKKKTAEKTRTGTLLEDYPQLRIMPEYRFNSETKTYMMDQHDVDHFYDRLLSLYYRAKHYERRVEYEREKRLLLQVYGLSEKEADIELARRMKGVIFYEKKDAKHSIHDKKSWLHFYTNCKKRVIELLQRPFKSSKSKEEILSDNKRQPSKNVDRYLDHIAGGGM